MKTVVAAVFVVGLLTGCKSLIVDSYWHDRPVTIDGSAEDWNGLLQYPENSKIGIGVLNDEKDLYLCLISSDEEVSSQFLGLGFSVTFKCKSQKGKCLGVHFPLGVRAPGKREGGSREWGKPDTAEMRARMETSLQTLALIGPEEKDTTPMSIRIAGSLGVVAAIKSSHGGFVYELKVPLKSDSNSKYTIGIGNDTIVSVLLATDEMSRPSGGPPGGDMGGGGPPGGGMGGGGPPGGGMGGGGPPSEPKQFKMEFSILMAKK